MDAQLASWSAQQLAATALSFIGFVLVSIPLYWHLEAWNVGCVLYIFWCGTQCLIQFINMTIWRDNVIVWVPVWCDIVTRFRLASSIGICTASLIINRRLYKIATISTVSMTNSDKRRMIWVDLAIGLIPSIVVVALFWFIQGHRFDIYEGYGCTFEIANTILSYFLLTSWPIVIGCISAVYCFFTLRAFFRRRKQFNELMSSNKNLTFHRYLRLMGLAGIEIACTVPLASWNLYMQSRNPLYVWKGLGDLHYDFSRVDQFPAILWLNNEFTKPAIIFDIWDIIICAFIFFAFFGCAEEARKHYSIAATTMAKRVGLSTSWLSRSTANGSYGYNTSKPTASALGRITIPTFVQHKRRNSLDSFSDRLSTSISIGEETPVDDLKVPYSPSEHSAGSSTYVPSPMSAKSAEKAHTFVFPPPPSPPARVHDPASPTRAAPPDVPASVHDNTFDIV
ncbi:pheromone A receptor-domain-containing protein [Fomitopsis serialis]|uniref:pheromone A receptor-domain-containing protein n=1 Tax=Fomitopsis serialis TaxID=139415 RepID=UPI0020080B55|nr:pheromone A receptor-domain-containing protein [Neoantrodia serialis]KAH9910602.1 pheromone A receptor-domain-containing protein [Neoantrodia serialis]